jgi:hypothetical protein
MALPGHPSSAEYLDPSDRFVLLGARRTIPLADIRGYLSVVQRKSDNVDGLDQTFCRGGNPMKRRQFIAL